MWHQAGKGRQGTQELHGLATGWAEHVWRIGGRGRGNELRICWGNGRWERGIFCKESACKRQGGAAVGSEETEVTNFHEAFWQDMLEEALDEMFNRESAIFELSSVGRAVLESDL